MAVQLNWPAQWSLFLVEFFFLLYLLPFLKPEYSQNCCSAEQLRLCETDAICHFGGQVWKVSLSLCCVGKIWHKTTIECFQCFEKRFAFIDSFGQTATLIDFGVKVQVQIDSDGSNNKTSRKDYSKKARDNQSFWDEPKKTTNDWWVVSLEVVLKRICVAKKMHSL